MNISININTIFTAVISMSVTASYVISVIIIVRLLIKRLPKYISYCIWSIAFLRLICPFSIESAISLIPNFNHNYIAYSIYNTSNNYQANTYVNANDNFNSFNSSTIPELSKTNTFNLSDMFPYIWISVVMIFLLYSTISALLLCRRLMSAEHVRSNIYMVSFIKTPFVFGFFKPKIYLPDGLSNSDSNYVISHEQIHIKRLDHIVKLLTFLIVCIHWFNPLVWIAFVLMSNDMEQSCDEAVIKKLGVTEKKDYSSLLLLMSSGKKFINGCPIAFGENNIKGRIKNILSYKKTAFWIMIISVILIIALCLCLTLNPKTALKSGQNLTDYTIANGNTSLQNGQNVSVKLVMTEGKYITGDDTAIGGGIAQQNYIGRCELKVTNLNDNKVLSSYDISSMSNNADELVFNTAPFSINFTDYNLDANPDFSIGQWGSSSMNVFSLFTIDSTGSISLISAPNAISSSAISDNDIYSAIFNHDETKITTEIYNNAIGEMQNIEYIWDNAKKIYISNSENNVNSFKITFPAYTGQLTEYNTDILNIDPFFLNIILPDGYTIKTKSIDDVKFPLIGAWTPMGIYNSNNEYVGAIGYNIYEEYEGAEQNPQAIYNQIALGNNYHFIAQYASNNSNQSYKPIITSPTGETAITEVYYSPTISKDLGYGDKEHLNKGILSYDRNLHCYVAIEFDSDALTNDDLIQVAKSVQFVSDSSNAKALTDGIKLNTSDDIAFSIMTDDNAPIGTEFGVQSSDSNADTLEVLALLENMNGFIFDREYVAHEYVKLIFNDEKPKDIYLRYCSENEWQTEYPIDSENYMIKVPTKQGVYSFFADITWKSGTVETAFFSITVK